MLLKSFYKKIRANIYLILFSFSTLLVSLLVDNKGILDFIYLSQHLYILCIAIIRPAPCAQDNSIFTRLSVIIGIIYPFVFFKFTNEVSNSNSLYFWSNVLVFSSIFLSSISLLSINTSFGIRPSIRVLKTRWVYSVIRHPLYLSYIILDIGYSLSYKLTLATSVILIGWITLIHRMNREEVLFMRENLYIEYCMKTPYRLIPYIF